MTTRRGFFARLAALIALPFAPKPSAALDLTPYIDRLLIFNGGGRIYHGGSLPLREWMCETHPGYQWGACPGGAHCAGPGTEWI